MEPLRMEEVVVKDESQEIALPEENFSSSFVPGIPENPETPDIRKIPEAGENTSTEVSTTLDNDVTDDIDVGDAEDGDEEEEEEDEDDHDSQFAAAVKKELHDTNDRYTNILHERLSTNEEIKGLLEEITKLQEQSQKVFLQRGVLQEQLTSGALVDECNRFFDAMLSSVQEEPETRETLHHRLELLEGSKFKTRLIRLQVYHSAVDYKNGTSTYFSELRERIGKGETERALERLVGIENELAETLIQKEEQRRRATDSIVEEVNAEKKKELDDWREEQKRLALVAEEEAREAQARKELERIQAEQDALRQEELQRQREQEAIQTELQEKLIDKGYSSEVPIVLGDKPLPGLEHSESPVIKTEEHRVDKIDEILEKFRSHDREGRRGIRAERAAKRALRMGRINRGEKNVSDDEWVDELDGPFDDDSETEESTTSQVIPAKRSSADSSTDTVDQSSASASSSSSSARVSYKTYKQQRANSNSTLNTAKRHQYDSYRPSYDGHPDDPRRNNSSRPYNGDPRRRS